MDAPNLLTEAKRAADHLESILERGNGSDITRIILRDLRAAIADGRQKSGGE